MNILLTVLLVVVALLGAAALFFSWQSYKAGQSRQPADQSLQLLQQQLENLRAQTADLFGRQSQLVNDQLGNLTNQVSQRLESVSQQMATSQKSVGERLDNAAKVVGDVQKSLGQLGQASERIFEVGKDIAGLQEILRAPKIRGGLGEYFLADLLGQILPGKHFKTGHGFKSGNIVDAVIHLGGKLVPVDSKFPLENFRRVVEAGSDEERRALKKKFVTDVKKHIDAIAAKYILPDEGTYDFAFMYIPAENVYYEVIVKDDADNTLTEYAMGKRVIPVSPNSFYAYLQAIILGLKGFQVEENARAILENLTRLQGDFVRFRDEFGILGKHIGQTHSKYEDIDKKLVRLQDKLSFVGEEKPSLTVETPSALPAKPQLIP